MDLTFIKSIVGNQPQTQSEVNANGQTLYMGYARKGAATSDALWIVVKFTYDANGNFQYEQSSKPYSIYDDRASLTYT